MEAAQSYEITGLDLSGTEYTVEQTGKDKNFRPEYEAEDVTGDTIFRCTHQMYEENDTFPFVDENGNELLTVEASSAIDIAGDYVLTDSHTGEDIVVLDNDLSLLQDTWRIRDAEDESLLATIASRGGLVTAGRKLLPAGQFIGHRYEITDSEGTAVGTIESDFAIQDQYEITISDSSSIPVGPIVVGTVVIDAIQDT
ncbi:hypothetical protein [Halapricum desulfuricans]|uniref:Uncharacterized protein n=1 Tax=Halapricum desulfuricans TaxID=2841257 RepID=A0A897NUL0_9EURY|nr:hypothetical protein [Halapricum desulfuricans]QSG15215.1 Uncharacterized protein HSEST_1692 [Halapricum desulfuricans]